MKILVWREDRETDPFSWEEASGSLQRGEFAAEDPARTEMMSEWKQLGELLRELLTEIYLLRDGNETGPFTRDEIFAGLLAGRFTGKDMGHTGASTNLHPLRDIIKETSHTFQVSQLLVVPESDQVVHRIPADLLSAPRRVSAETKIQPQQKKIELQRIFTDRGFLTMAAGLAILAFAVCSQWFGHPRETSPAQSSQSENLAGKPAPLQVVAPATSVQPAPTAPLLSALARIKPSLPGSSAVTPPAGPSSAAVAEAKSTPPAAPAQTTLLQLALASESPQPAVSGSEDSSASNEPPLPGDTPGANKEHKSKSSKRPHIASPGPAADAIPQYEQVAFIGRVADPEAQDSGFDHLSEAQLTSIISDRMQLTPEPVNEHYGERIDPKSTLYEGKFYLDTNLKWNPKVEVLYSLPMRSKTQHGPYANNIIMMGFWHAPIEPIRTKKPKPMGQNQQGQQDDNLNRLDHDQGQIDQEQDQNQQMPDPFGDGDDEPTAHTPRWSGAAVSGTAQEPRDPLYDQLTYFSQGLGFTAFTMRIHTDHHDLLNPTEAYYMGGPEWQEIVFRAQDEITRLQKLQPRKLMLYGHSQGGMFVERIAVAQPDRVAALAIESAPATLPPVTGAGPTWFLGITRGDANTDGFLDLTAKLHEVGAQVLYNRFPPDFAQMGYSSRFYHAETTLERAASRAYLRGVADRMDSRGEVDPRQWPFVRDINSPMRMVPASSYQAEPIPEANREYLPSQEFVRLIQSVPTEVQYITIPGRMGYPVRSLVALPPLGRVKGVIVYCDAPGYQNVATTLNNIYYLAGLNYVVIAPRMASSVGDPIGANLAFIQRWDVLKNLPLVFLGVGPKANDAWDFAAFNRGIPLKAIAISDFDPKDSLDQSKLPPGGGISCPALFVYQEKEADRVRDEKQAKAYLDRLQAVANYLESAKQQDHIALSHVIPGVLPWTQEQQQAMQVAGDFIGKVIDNKLGELVRSEGEHIQSSQ